MKTSPKKRKLCSVAIARCASKWSIALSRGQMYTPKQSSNATYPRTRWVGGPMKSTILVAGASGQTVFAPFQLEQAHHRAIFSNLSGFRRRGGDRHFRRLFSSPGDICHHLAGFDLALFFWPCPLARVDVPPLATAPPPCPA